MVRRETGGFFFCAATVNYGVEVKVMRIPSTNLVYHFAADTPPVAECSVGEECVFETLDCFGGQIRNESDRLEAIDVERANPATGLVFVRGAKRGMLLRVEILDITCVSFGLISTHPGIGVLRSSFNRYFFKMVTLHENRGTVEGTSFPLNPMIGVIGVAPESGAISTRFPGNHGGNLDTREIRSGNTLYLPVFHEGARFALGDVHAAMGDGEICGAGVEVAASVRVRFGVIENHWDIATPLIEEKERFIFLYSASQLESAFYEGAAMVLRILQKATGWSEEKIYLLMSATCDFQVSQLVDPLYTVKIAIPREVFPFTL